MNEIIRMIEESIQDNVLISSEKKEIKKAIQTAKLTKRELDLLRSKVFDIARAHQDQLSADSLINWLESTNKLTLPREELAQASDAYFSPGKACQSAIIQHLKSARESVKICVFTISDNEITKEILAAEKRGIGVKVITDNEKLFDKGSDISEMARKGVPTRVDASEYHMHHKFCIIDRKHLITGSYNWTRSAAERNEENIIITQESGIIRKFLVEFDHLWDKFEPYRG